jgi:hypothetical protein
MMQLHRNLDNRPTDLRLVRDNRSSAQTESVEETRGLKAPVRFFIDYCISVAVNSVARKQALRVKMNLRGSSGLRLSLGVSTTDQSGGTKFVAYSDNIYGLLGCESGLFVIDETPRELEHSIYLYLSEHLAGQESVVVEISRETNSRFALPVLEGCSQNGTRSLSAWAV